MRLSVTVSVPSPPSAPSPGVRVPASVLRAGSVWVLMGFSYRMSRTLRLDYGCPRGVCPHRPGAGRAPGSARGRRCLEVKARTRAGAAGAGSPWGPLRGARGSLARGWCGWCGRSRGPMPPSSVGPVSGVWRTAHLTIRNSATIGIFRKTISQRKVHMLTVPIVYPAYGPVQPCRGAARAPP